MKIIEIRGRIWDLTTMQQSPFGGYCEDAKSHLHIPQNEANIRAIQGLSIQRNGCGRLLANNAVRSTARAIIETTVSGLPTQIGYDIYHNSKGYYCNVQGQRVFLKDLLKETNNDK